MRCIYVKCDIHFAFRIHPLCLDANEIDFSKNPKRYWNLFGHVHICRNMKWKTKNESRSCLIFMLPLYIVFQMEKIKFVKYWHYSHIPSKSYGSVSELVREKKTTVYPLVSVELVHTVIMLVEPPRKKTASIT